MQQQREQQTRVKNMVLSVEGFTRSSNMSSKAVNLKTEDGRVAPSTRSLVRLPQRFMLYAL